MTETSDEKSELRERLLDRRDALDPKEQRAASQVVIASLAELLEPYEDIAGYVSFRNEIDLRPLYQSWLDAGERVYLPRVVGPGEMVFVPVTDLDGLQHGQFGIPEPVGEAAPLVDIDAFIVPGVAFDRDGHRLGFGGGFYDRLLSERLSLATPPEMARNIPFFVGIGYEWQLLDRTLPNEPHDVDLHRVVTDDGIVRCADQN